MAHPTNRKWVITPVINGISRVNPLIIGVITHLLSGMSHQAWLNRFTHGFPGLLPGLPAAFTAVLRPCSKPPAATMNLPRWSRRVGVLGKHTWMCVSSIYVCMYIYICMKIYIRSSIDLMSYSNMYIYIYVCMWLVYIRTYVISKICFKLQVCLFLSFFLSLLACLFVCVFSWYVM